MYIQPVLPTRVDDNATVILRYVTESDYAPGYLPEWAIDCPYYSPVPCSAGLGAEIAHDVVEHLGLGVVTTNPFLEELATLGSQWYARPESCIESRGIGLHTDDYLLGKVSSVLCGLLNEPARDSLFVENYDKWLDRLLFFYDTKPDYSVSRVLRYFAKGWPLVVKECQDNTSSQLLGYGMIDLGDCFHARLQAIAEHWVSLGFVRAARIDIAYGKGTVKDIYTTVSSAWSNYVSLQQMVEQGWYPDLKLDYTYSRGRVNATIQRI